jgi:hypothetical protein
MQTTAATGGRGRTEKQECNQSCGSGKTRMQAANHNFAHHGDHWCPW